jgi:hypothetical protein
MYYVRFRFGYRKAWTFKNTGTGRWMTWILLAGIISQVWHYGDFRSWAFSRTRMVGDWTLVSSRQHYYQAHNASDGND